MADKKIRCATCGTAMTLRTAAQKVDFGLDRAVVVEDAVVGHCDACGEDYQGIKDMSGLLHHVAQALANKSARLTPREIRFLREHLGLTGVALAGELGVEPATAYRWERAAKPTPMGLTAERLLRLMVLDSAAGRLPTLARLGVTSAKTQSFRLARRGGGWHERKAG